nr:uncharacterized protein LOC112802150 isoform X11 [Arachis hypogaea]
MESRRSKAMAAQKNGRRSNQERKMALIQDEQSRSGCTRTEKARHWRWISWDVLLTYCSRMQEGDAWFLNTPEQSLSFILADQGFDVWVENVRGTHWSHGHRSYSVKNKQIPFIQMKISFIEENNAGNAAAALMARLAPKAKDLPTTVFLLVKLTQRHLRLPGISMRSLMLWLLMDLYRARMEGSGEWGDHLTLQAAADKIYLLSFPKNWISLNLTNNLYACLFLCILCMTMIEEHASISLK